MKVAVMGCIVNGPKESKHADIGISLPGTGESPASPVFVDGAKACTLRGERIAEESRRWPRATSSAASVPSARAPERATRALPTGLVVRSLADADVAGIEQLVSDVVSEVYGDLFPGGPPPPAGQWQCGLVAELSGRIVGVVVADDDWVEDLWVAGGRRGCGIGSVLLAAAERQIAERGHGEARLRVVARNAWARRFYGTRGWTESGAHPHETWGFAMLELRKKLAA